MKVLMSMVGLSCFGLTTIVHANEVLLTSKQPTKITYRVAHQNHQAQPVFGEVQAIDLNKNTTISINLNNFDLAGLVIMSVNGHELPPSANQFDQPKQCSMTTDKTRATGALEFTTTDHSINCQSFGGIFG
jgi:hypothetical protein